MPTEGMSKSALRGLIWQQFKAGIFKLTVSLGIYAFLCALLALPVKSSTLYQTDPHLIHELVQVLPILLIGYFFMKGMRWLNNLDAQQTKWLATADPAEIRQTIEQPKWSRGKGLIFVMAFTTLIALLATCPALILLAQRPHFGKNAFALLEIFLIIIFLLFGLFGLAYLSETFSRSKKQQFAMHAGFEYIDPPQNVDGFDITSGSVIAHGQGDQGYANLIRGKRSNYSFRAIDYEFPHGRGADRQTIICINLTQVNLTSFSIISDDDAQLGNAKRARKAASDKYAAKIANGYALMVDEHRQTALNVPIGILDAFSDHGFARKQSLNMEYMGNRLLVYRFCHRLTGHDFLQVLDVAIALATKFA